MLNVVQLEIKECSLFGGEQVTYNEAEVPFFEDFT